MRVSNQTIDSTSNIPWLVRIENTVVFDSIQQILYELPAYGDVWKEMEFSETTSLEIMDGYLKMRTLYFNDGILVAPGNSAYYSTSSEIQKAYYAKWTALYSLAESLLNLQDTDK